MFSTTIYNPLSPLYNTAMWFDAGDDSVDVARSTKENDTRDRSTSDTRSSRNRLRRAAAQTSRTDRGYNITVEMPGVVRDNVEVKIEGNLLTVTGKRSLNDSETISYFSNWTVGENVTVSGITARCEAGLLELFIPTVAPQNLIITVD